MSHGLKKVVGSSLECSLFVHPLWNTLEVDSSVPLTHHDPKDLGLICLVKRPKIHFQILSDLNIHDPILEFLKEIHCYMQT